MAKRRGLGRGLDSLIPPSETPTGEDSGLRLVPITQISPNPHQPRSSVDEQKLAELAQSIQEHGLIQPLVVTKVGAEAFTLIAGERRWRAAKVAGLQEVPVVIKEASPQDMLELALIENIQRDDLNALEEALAYQQLISEFGLTQEEVARRVGKSRSTIANMVRLLNLPQRVQAAVIDGQISGAHARALLPFVSEQTQIAVMNTIVVQDLSVRQVEAMSQIVRLPELDERVKAAVIDGRISPDHALALLPLPTAEAQVELANIAIKMNLSAPQVEAIVEKRLSGKKPAPTRAKALSPELKDLEAQFRESLSTEVRIQHGKKGGKVIIHYHSDEELQAIYEAITGNL